MTKKKNKDLDASAAIEERITEVPTRSDAQIAADLNEAGRDDVDRFLVADVRAQMGAKHTWKGSNE